MSAFTFVPIFIVFFNDAVNLKDRNITVKIASVKWLVLVVGDVLARDFAKRLVELELVDVSREVLEGNDNNKLYRLKNGPFQPFFVYFRLFKQTLQILQQINVKKCPSRIRSWDLNSQPSANESPPITTRPGLPP